MIVATTATQQLSRRLPVEVIRDPVIENEIDPFEEGTDRNHQVLFSVSYIITYRFLMCENFVIKFQVKIMLVEPLVNDKAFGILSIKYCSMVTLLNESSLGSN